MNVFTIKDLENLSGIKAHTIRIWEQRYSFLKPQRTNTNIRFYTTGDLKLILNIALLNRYGYKISHINRMGEEEMKDKILSLTQPHANEERVINDLIQHMVALDMEEFETSLNNYIHLYSFQKAVSQIIFPFLERIGILWTTDNISSAQEHLVSNIIRQKIIAAIDKLEKQPREAKNVILFLPENEYHELGLLFVYYLLRKKGIKVVYLGTTVPLNDLQYIVEQKKPHYLYSHITSSTGNARFEKFFSNLQNRIGELPVIVSGAVAQQNRKATIQNISFKKSLTEVEEFIESL